MLKTATLFPQPGSFALYRDDELEPEDRRPELARILELGVNSALISLPLRTGAGGTKRVARADLEDATELTPAEQAEMVELERQLRTRVRGRPALEARVAALRNRALWAPMMRSLLRRWRASQPDKAVAA